MLKIFFVCAELSSDQLSSFCTSLVAAGCRAGPGSDSGIDFVRGDERGSGTAGGVYERGPMGLRWPSSARNVQSPCAHYSWRTAVHAALLHTNKLAKLPKLPVVHGVAVQRILTLDSGETLDLGDFPQPALVAVARTPLAEFEVVATESFLSFFVQQRLGVADEVGEGAFLASQGSRRRVDRQ